MTRTQHSRSPFAPAVAATSGSAFVRCAAVLGAGTMGIQIAALLANAGIPTLLYDLPAEREHEHDDHSHGSAAAITRLSQLRPPPLATPEQARCIEALDYRQHLSRLHDCDLVIEAICEQFDAKQGFYARIAPHLGQHTLLTSATAGLSINRLARALPENCRARFCGTQFFNPPRYRQLVELISSDFTDPKRLDQLEHFLFFGLGKTVIRVNDRPPFLANQIGLMAMLTATHHAERYALAPDLVDALTRAAFELDEPAVYGTLNALGVAQVEQLLDNARQALPDDAWLQKLRLPDWLPALNGRGIYRRRSLQVFDPAAGDYRSSSANLDGGVRAALAAEELSERFLLLRANRHPQARFLSAVLCDVLHYCAAQAGQLCDAVWQLDLAMRCGFGWRRGPFELWQALGWRETTDWLESCRREQTTLTSVPLPAWCHSSDGAYTADGAYSTIHDKYAPPILGVGIDAAIPTPRQLGITLFQHAASGLRLWQQPDSHVAILSYDSGDKAFDDEAFHQALELAANSSAALVLWNDVPYFYCQSPNTNHRDDAALEAAEPRRSSNTQSDDLGNDDWCSLGRLLAALPIPVVAALHGRVFDRGVELMLHCDRSVAILETHFGLAASDPGLSIAQALTRRAAQIAATGDCPLLPYLRPYFNWLLRRPLIDNALAARKYGLLTPADPIIMQPRQLLQAACASATALIEAGHRSTPLQLHRFPSDAERAELQALLDEHLTQGSIGPAEHRYGLTLTAALCAAAA